MRDGRVGQLAAQLRAGRSIVDFASGTDASLLAAAPLGRADALTPWLQAAASQKLAGFLRADSAQAQAARSSTLAAQAPEAISLQPGDTAASLASLVDSLAQDGASSSRPRSLVAAETSSSRAVAAQSGAQRGAVVGRESAKPSATGRAAGQNRSPLAAIAADSRIPSALKAALALFAGGDASTLAAANPAQFSSANAYLAKWFGRSDLTARSSALAAQGGAGPTIGLGREGQAAGQGLADGSGSRGSSQGARGSAAAQAPAAAKGAESFALTGLAALAALQQPPEVLEALLHAQGAGSPQELRIATAERAMLQPGADAGTGDNGAGAAGNDRGTSSAAKGSSRGQTTPRARAGGLHQFAPVGLSRGRDLLSLSRRSGAASSLKVTDKWQGRDGVQGRDSLWAPRAGTSPQAGYGDASLGGGELVGLGLEDASQFHGDVSPLPSAVRGAGLLAQAVQARRSARTGRGHIAAVGAGQGQSGASRTWTGGSQGQGPSGMPSDFNYGDHSLVNPAAAVQDMHRNQGASASTRGVQASAMARVFSVTSDPGANVLPLVAPAASAVVAAAAAKPLSESIVTSGSDATVGMPTASIGGGQKKGKESQGAASGGQGHDEDLDALAGKIARSVMMRIKRERERRGIHG